MVVVFGGGEEVKVVNDGLVMVIILLPIPTIVILALVHGDQFSVLVLELDALNCGKDLELF
jgi:hypothetical protein